ncbi:MAG: tetratricopeptide repeat protein [Sandaracinus sp.]|nr:tetratricopeptide repeat protein [Sandaracinus sp.]
MEGRRDEALEHAARAVSLVERARGPEDLALLEPLRQLGDVRARLRDFVGAIEPLERARRIASTLPEAHPERLAIDARYASVLDGAGRRAEALPIARRTRDLAMESLPPAHPVLAFVRLKFADTLVHGGEVEAALPEYEAALAATVAAYGESHTETARALLNLAGAEARLGRTDAAIERWTEALEMRERLLGREHPDLAIVLQNIGSVQTERGRAREALGVLERAWTIRHERPASPMARADLDYWLGPRALRERRGSAARSAARRARGRDGAPRRLRAAGERHADVARRPSASGAGRARLHRTSTIVAHSVIVSPSRGHEEDGMRARKTAVLGSLMLLACSSEEGAGSSDWALTAEDSADAADASSVEAALSASLVSRATGRRRDPGRRAPRPRRCRVSSSPRGASRPRRRFGARRTRSTLAADRADSRRSTARSWSNTPSRATAR